MQSLISIIIPVFNTTEFITNCLHSVFNQTYQNLEIIVIDNGSHDACQKLLEDLEKQDERVTLYQLEENQGPGYARNLGIQKATGDYLYFLDSDDYLPQETIELLVDNIGEHPLIIGKMKNTNFDGGITIVLPGGIKPALYKKGRFKLLKSRSALNWLIKRSYVLENNLSFSEQYDVFNDVHFMIPALKRTKKVPYIKEAIYFKRTRHDPVLNPSLKQMNKKDYALSFFHMYHDNKDTYKQKQIQKELDRQLVHFYDKNLVRYFDGDVDIKDIFPELSKALKRTDKNVTANQGRFARRELKAIFNQDEKAYERIYNQHLLLRDLRGSLKTKRKMFKFLYKHVFCRLPVNDHLVFFESFLGRSYSDNPKYIYEYLDKHHPEYKTVWSMKEKTNIPGKAKQVNRFSLGYFYTLARAKYWVSNSKMPLYLKKRHQGVYLQTWHGTPLKRIGFDVDAQVNQAGATYRANFYKQSRRWDYMNASNEFTADIFRRTFLYENIMLKYGYPRNDLLYQNDNPEDILKLKQKLGLPTDKKIVLYAPTWRDDGFVAKGVYNFTLELDLKELQEKLGSDYIVILRMHYLISEQQDISEFEGFAYNFSDYDDVGELYLISDMLITDYSSVFFDYANLKRPILFYTYDLEEYRDELRGFYLDMETELPGPLLQTTEEVIDAIVTIDQVNEDYADQYADFYERFCSWDDGRASERTVQTVFLGNEDGDWK